MLEYYMRRLTKKERSQIIKLYQSGKSLSQISKLFNRKKNVIYYHTRKRFGRKFKQINFKADSLEDLGEFLGAFIGDGGFYKDKDFRYKITFYLSIQEMGYAQKLSRIIKRLFGKKPNVWVYKKGNVIQVKIMGKQIQDKIKEYLSWSGEKCYTIHLKSKLLESPDHNLLRGIIRGELATDGSVYPPKNRVTLGTSSKLLSDQNSNILKMFKINSFVYKTISKGHKAFYHMHITGIDNVINFYEKIGVTEPIRKSKIESILKKRQ